MVKTHYAAKDNGIGRELNALTRSAIKKYCLTKKPKTRKWTVQAAGYEADVDCDLRPVVDKSEASDFEKMSTEDRRMANKQDRIESSFLWYVRHHEFDL